MSYRRLHPVRPASTLFSVKTNTACQHAVAIALQAMDEGRMNEHRQPNTDNRALPPPAHFAEPRSITVREAARLQGFPDTFRVYGSFVNQMEQVTNIRVTTMSPLISAGCGEYRLKSRRTPDRADITGYQSWRPSGLTDAC